MLDFDAIIEKWKSAETQKTRMSESLQTFKGVTAGNSNSGI